MNLQALSSHPKLKKLIRECDKGDLLFSEGDPANTVFLVLEGSLELSIKQQNKQIRIGKVNSGEFIGERALLQEEPFNRKASATALSQTFLLELGPDQFSQLEKEAVGVYLLLLKKAFKTLISRNEALEEFGEALKSYDPRRRFLSYLL
jgi:CRP-like cAMP-binding protein